MAEINPVFHNQVRVNENTPYFATENLKKKIAAQLRAQTPGEQEATIEALLKLLDINLLVALDMAYGAAPRPVTEEGE